MPECAEELARLHRMRQPCPRPRYPSDSHRDLGAVELESQQASTRQTRRQENARLGRWKRHWFSCPRITESLRWTSAHSSKDWCLSRPRLSESIRRNTYPRQYDCVADSAAHQPSRSLATDKPRSINQCAIASQRAVAIQYAAANECVTACGRARREGSGCAPST